LKKAILEKSNIR